MNSTNRFANRLGLFVIGLLLLSIGGAVVAASLVPEWGAWWTDGGQTARAWVDRTLAGTTIADSTLSWIAVVVVAGLLIAIILLIVAMTRLGGGRTSTVLDTSRDAADPDGAIVVESSFTSDALGHSLGKRPEVLSSHVSAHRIHSTPVMHVSVTPRQNTSPLAIAHDVDRLLGNLATVTGEAIPTYLSIHSGLRARLARDKTLA